MRRLMVFILRLWGDLDSDPPPYEGQVECVASGERMHIQRPDEIIQFIETCFASSTPKEIDPEQEEIP
jgi:hypothetical protein